MSTQPEEQAANTRTLAQIDNEFQQLACLGHGGFGSVFLAKKKSGRRVALKFMNIGIDSEDQYEFFTRELDAVTRLKLNDRGQENRDLAIVFFEEWFTGPGFACIVMNYVDGGTLAQEIASKTDGAPYTERRIAWYALQLSEALAYAHERGVAHHDVKSSNVLIDRTGGGKLLLADFGSAIAPGEESVLFTEIYAPPELQAAHARDDYTGLEADKVDAFGLGCILFELLCCRKLVDLTGDQTLAEFIQGEGGVDAALDLPALRLPWLSVDTSYSEATQVVGYSVALRSFTKTLLEPRPENRWTPSHLPKHLRQDPLSPLLADYVVAAQTPVPGAPVTVDNIQLGMFVQRGQHWDDGGVDGSQGSIGVIVKLDADAGYTEVSWPARTPDFDPKPMCCRIGASNKFELQVGPTPLRDFCGEPRMIGILRTNDVSSYSVGHLINSNCIVVGIQYRQELVFVAPMERIPIPTLPFSPISPPAIASVGPRKPQPPPDSWQSDAGLLAEVNDMEEKGSVLDLFHAVDGGMDIQDYEILSIKRVQSVDLWTAYSRSREDVAAANWGVTNEQRLFHGTGELSPEALIQNPCEFYQKCTSVPFSRHTVNGDIHCHKNASGNRQIVLSRVALGRVDEQLSDEAERAHPHLSYHSQKKPSQHNNDTEVFTIRNVSQAVPEYIITYKAVQVPGRRLVRARRPGGANPSPVANPSRHTRLRSSRRANGNRQGGTILPIAFPPLAAGRASSAQMPQRSMTKGQGHHPGARPTLAAANHSVNETKNAATVPDGEQEAVAGQKEITCGEKKGPSATKMCVVCLERPVRKVLLPCGHPCLCQICSTEQGLVKLRRKCPECRTTIREAATIYGRVVDD